MNTGTVQQKERKREVSEKMLRDAALFVITPNFIGPLQLCIMHGMTLEEAVLNLREQMPEQYKDLTGGYDDNSV